MKFVEHQAKPIGSSSSVHAIRNVDVNIRDGAVGKSVGPASGWCGVRIPAATDRKVVKTGSDTSTSKCSAVRVSVTGPRR